MKNIKKSKLKSLPHVFLLIFFFTFVCLARKSIQTVSERELLLLSIMSYNNNQNTNVSETIIDNNFERKWFAGYGDISELKGWRIVDSIINTDAKKMAGFSVISYKKGKNLVIAFRGTDSGIVQENWGYFILNNEHPQAKYVNQYINNLKNVSFVNQETNIYLTGHSLGGYLATFALGKIMGINELKDKLVKATTFNGLGIGYTSDKAMIKRLSKIGPDKLVNYAVRGDVVVLIGRHFTKVKYLDFIPKSFDATMNFISGPHFPYNFLAQSPFLKNSINI